MIEPQTYYRPLTQTEYRQHTERQYKELSKKYKALIKRPLPANYNEFVKHTEEIKAIAVKIAKCEEIINGIPKERIRKTKDDEED